MAVWRSQVCRGEDLEQPPPPLSDCLVRSDITRGRLRGHFHEGDIFYGRHEASPVVAGLRSSSPNRLVHNHMPLAVLRSYVHGGDVHRGRSVPSSAVTTPNSSSILPRPRPQRHPPQSSSTATSHAVVPYHHIHAGTTAAVLWPRPRWWPSTLPPPTQPQSEVLRSHSVASSAEAGSGPRSPLSPPSGLVHSDTPSLPTACPPVAWTEATSSAAIPPVASSAATSDGSRSSSSPGASPAETSPTAAPPGHVSGGDILCGCTAARPRRQLLLLPSPRGLVGSDIARGRPRAVAVTGGDDLRGRRVGSSTATDPAKYPPPPRPRPASFLFLIPSGNAPAVRDPSPSVAPP